MTQAPPPLFVSQSQGGFHSAPINYDDGDDNKSQASTVIEDSQSGTSESSCDANEGLEIETDNVCNDGFTGNYNYSCLIVNC